MNWSSQKKKVHFLCLFCLKEMFLTFGFILIYSVLNKLSEYMYFSILKKNITLHTFVTCI